MLPVCFKLIGVSQLVFKVCGLHASSPVSVTIWHSVPKVHNRTRLEIASSNAHRSKSCLNLHELDRTARTSTTSRFPTGIAMPLRKETILESLEARNQKGRLQKAGVCCHSRQVFVALSTLVALARLYSLPEFMNFALFGKPKF